jgi:hypothetical protein
MKRRLYFLLPDAAHVERAINDIEAAGIARRHMHLMGRSVEGIRGLGPIRVTKGLDAAYWVEWWLWRINLALFVTALLALVAMLIWSPSYLAIVPLVVMVASLVAGIGFVTHVPSLHLNEFRNAIAHGENLLMVDVPLRRVAGIEDLVRTAHPEAVVGGVGWMSEIVG